MYVLVWYKATLQPIPHPTLVNTIMHHTRIIGIDHVSVIPPDIDGYIGLLLLVDYDTHFMTTPPSPWLLLYFDTFAPLAALMLSYPTQAVLLLPTLSVTLTSGSGSPITSHSSADISSMNLST